MKKKVEKSKKLALSTETVRNLDREDLILAGGGRSSIVAGTDNGCTTSACSC